MRSSAPHGFADRRAAGRQLASRLAALAPEQPIVLGLARGGIPVAYEIAQTLDAPLDVLVARKIGAPENPEFGIGAIAEGEPPMLDTDTLRWLKISDADLRRALARARMEVDARAVPPVAMPSSTTITVRPVISSGRSPR